MSAGEFLQPWTAQTNKDYSQNKDYAVGVNIIVEWVANFTNATITLWQDNKAGDAQGGPSINLEESYNKTTWGWKVSYEGLDPGYNNVFYFAVSEGNGDNSFTSHYFNISNALSTTSPSTSAAGSTASSISLSTAYSTSPVSTTLTSSQSTSRATITLAPSSDGGTPVGIIAGVVVGTVVGALLLVGAAWFVWKLKKRRTTAARAQSSNVASGQPYLYTEQKPYEADTNPIHNLHEADTNQIHNLHEADTNQIHELHESDGIPTYELQESVR